MSAPLASRLTAKAVLGAVIGPIARGSNQLVTFVLTLVAMRYLDPAQFGAFALAVIATTVIRTLLYTGTFEFLLKAPDVRDGASEALCLNVLIALGCSSLVGLGCLAGLSAGADEEIVFLLLLLLPSNLVSAVGAWQESQLLRTGRITPYYFSTFGAEFVSMVLAVALFASGFGVLSLAVQIYARNILLLVLYGLISRPVLSARFSGKRLREIVSWATPVYGSSSLGLVSNYAADVLLGLFLSPAATGIYRASNRLVTAVADIINQPTRLVSMTLSSKKVAQGEDAATLWTIVLSIAGAFGWSALAGLAVTADLLVPTLLGADWQTAAPIVALLCLARAFTVLDAAMAPALVAHDHQHALLRVQTVSTMALLTMMAAAAPFGLVYATAATIAAALLKSSIMLVLAVRLLPGSGASLRRHLPVALAPALAVGLVATSAAVLLGRTDLAANRQVVAVILSGVVAWAACLALLRFRVQAIIRAMSSQHPKASRRSPASSPTDNRT